MSNHFIISHPNKNVARASVRLSVSYGFITRTKKRRKTNIGWTGNTTNYIKWRRL